MPVCVWLSVSSVCESLAVFLIYVCVVGVLMCVGQHPFLSGRRDFISNQRYRIHDFYKKTAL